MDAPNTLQKAIIYFSEPKNCNEFMIRLRWADGTVRCPHCDYRKVTYLEKQNRYKCYGKHPKAQFSLKVGTIFEDSPLGLDKWLTAIWLIANCKNGVSSYELHRALGVTQKSAWFMLQRIRLAMQTGTFRKLSGEVEADESFIGGKARNMHASKRKARIQGRGPEGKAIVMGLLERHGEVRATVVESRRKPHVQAEVRKHVQPGSAVYTDALLSYDGLGADYLHEFIDHAEEYVRGAVHTNGLENFWSLLKRSLGGTYVSVEPFHLFRYVDEQAFRFNNRKVTDVERFANVVRNVTGRRLTYNEVTGKAEQPS